MFERIHRAGQERNQSRYTWLRYVVALSTGLFSAVFVGNQFDVPVYALLKAALMCNAFALLFGLIALYGELETANRLLKALVLAYIGSEQETDVGVDNGKIVSPTN